MKKSTAAILAAVMALSLSACGGGSSQPAASSAAPAAPAVSVAPENKVSEGSYANGDGSFRFLYSYDNKEAVMKTPEGAEVEAFGIYDPAYAPKENVIQSNSLSFAAPEDLWYCQARDYESCYVTNIEHLAQYYFNGELDEEGQAEYPVYGQTVQELGFQYLGKPVLLIQSQYQSASGIDWTTSFVGIEYDNKSAPDGGKGLVGLDFFQEEYTKDQMAWVAGQIFGVDSGVKGDPFDEDAAASSAPSVPDVAASTFAGTWSNDESNWGEQYTFNTDGTGIRSYTETSEVEDFTYTVKGDTITIDFGEDEAYDYTIAVSGDKLTLTDNFGAIPFTKVVEEAPAAPTPEPEAEPEPEPEDDTSWAALGKKLVGTWNECDGIDEDTWVFNADGSGKYIYGDSETNYTWSNDDTYVILTYAGGDEGYWFFSFKDNGHLVLSDGSTDYEYEKE